MLMGPLIWYLATFPQRAALQSLDPTLNDVFVPFNLSIHTTTNFIEDAKWLVKDVQADGYRLLLRTKYNVIKDPKQKVIVDKGHLNIVILNKDDYEALHPNNDNGIFLSPNLLYLKVEKIGGFEKLKPVMEEVLGLRLTKLKYEENKEDLSKVSTSIITVYLLFRKGYQFGKECPSTLFITFSLCFYMRTVRVLFRWKRKL